MARVYLGIGSNIDREKNISGCLQSLKTRFGALDISPVYECSPVGFEGNNFFNLVVGLDTELTIIELSTVLKFIESDFGRTRSQEKFLPRTLDIDLLLFGDLIRHDDKYDLPRADILDYAFVLRPLADIAGNTLHPELQISYQELWQQFDRDEQPLWLANCDLS